MMAEAGETLSAHEIIYLDSNGKAKKADVDAPTTATLLGITLDAIVSGNQGRVQVLGPVGDASWSWTKGAKL